MKKVAGALVAISLVVVAGDHAARNVAEGRLERHLAEGLDLPENEVRIAGWPFVTQLLEGNLSRIDVEAPSVETRSIRFSGVTMKLEDLVLPPAGTLLSGEFERVTVGSGSGTGYVTESNLNDALASSGVTERFEISAEGVTSAGTDRLVEINIAARSLVLAVEGTDVLRYELPPLGLAVRYGDVTVEDGRLHITFELIRNEIHLP